MYRFTYIHTNIYVFINTCNTCARNQEPEGVIMQSSSYVKNTIRVELWKEHALSL